MRTPLWFWDDYNQSLWFNIWWPGGKKTIYSNGFMRWCISNANN